MKIAAHIKGYYQVGEFQSDVVEEGEKGRGEE